MPLVRIDVIEGRTDQEIRQLADIVQEVMLDVFGAPPRDRYQVIHEHKAGRMHAEDTGLGFERTDGVVVIQVTERGRDEAEEGALLGAGRPAGGRGRRAAGRPHRVDHGQHAGRLVLRPRPSPVSRGRPLSDLVAGQVTVLQPVAGQLVTA